MFDVEALRHVERVYRFRYPPAFWQRHEELAALAASEPFRAAYPAARLVGTHDEVWATRQADPHENRGQTTIFITSTLNL